MPLERILKMEAAWDKRSDDPKKDFGIHGVTMRFSVKGELGAVQFVLYTGWNISEIRVSQPMFACTPNCCLNKPLPAELGYHSATPDSEDQVPTDTGCDLVDGGICYYEGSALAAEEPFNVLTDTGLDGLWLFLEERYSDVFLEEGTSHG